MSCRYYLTNLLEDKTSQGNQLKQLATISGYKKLLNVPDGNDSGAVGQM